MLGVFIILYIGASISIIELGELMLEKIEKSKTTAKTASAVLPEADTPITRFKAEVIRLTNTERKKTGIAGLEALEILGPMADKRAQEASAQFQHTRPDGTRCFTIFTENSLKYRAVGENLAYGFKTPETVVAAWMNSEGHRRNILDPDFKYVGCGYYVNEKGKIYSAALYYTPKSGK